MFVDWIWNLGLILLSKDIWHSYYLNSAGHPLLKYYSSVWMGLLGSGVIKLTRNIKELLNHQCRNSKLMSKGFHKAGSFFFQALVLCFISMCKVVVGRYFSALASHCLTTQYVFYVMLAENWNIRRAVSRWLRRSRYTLCGFAMKGVHAQQCNTPVVSRLANYQNTEFCSGSEITVWHWCRHNLIDRRLG